MQLPTQAQPIKAATRRVTPFYTILEDDGVYLSPKQLRELVAQAERDNATLEASIAATYDRAGILGDRQSEADDYFENAWKTVSAGRNRLNLGYSTYQIARFMFALGLLWGGWFSKEGDKPCE
jgi:hypothetical protein